MIPNKRILIFDAGAINNLADDPNAPEFIGKIQRTFRVRITGSNLEEIMGAPTAVRRQQLTTVCRELLTVGQCILPFHEIIIALASRFKSHPAFNWRFVPIHFSEADAAVRNRNFSLSDAFARQQHMEMREYEATFKSIFRDAQPAFEEIKKQNSAPQNLSELVECLQIPSGAYWAFGMDFYRRATGCEIGEAEVRKLIDICAPFKALILAVCMAEFEYCFRDYKTEISYRAGRVDLYSATYLPNCDVFITAERRRRQENALKEIVRAGKLGIRIVSYDDFRLDLTTPFGRNDTSGKSISAREFS